MSGQIVLAVLIGLVALWVLLNIISVGVSLVVGESMKFALKLGTGMWVAAAAISLTLFFAVTSMQAVLR